MSIETFRWKYTCFLLSLDRMAQLWPDLWVRIGDASSVRSELQRILVPYLSEERSYGDGHLIALNVLGTLHASLGTEAVTSIRDWCTHVLINGGPDRAQESFWSSICAQLTNVTGGVPNWVQQRCDAVSANARSRKAILASKLEIIRHAPLSSWDRRVLDSPFGSAGDVDTAVAVVAKANAFVEAWDQECSDLSTEQLVMMWRAVQPLKAELGMAEVDIEVPGRWLHELADFLDAAKADRG